MNDNDRHATCMNSTTLGTPSMKRLDLDSRVDNRRNSRMRRNRIANGGSLLLFNGVREIYHFLAGSVLIGGTQVMGPDDYIETVLTCKGDFYHPEFPRQLERFSESLRQLIQTDKQTVIIKKVEPWNSVRVTFNIPKQAAQRLRQLAEQGSQGLQEIGVLAVQIEGDRVISLTIAGKNNERTELVLRTSDVSAPSTSMYQIDSGSAAAGSPSKAISTLFGSSAAGTLMDTLGLNVPELSPGCNIFRPPGSVAASPSPGTSNPMLVQPQFPFNDRNNSIAGPQFAQGRPGFMPSTPGMVSANANFSPPGSSPQFTSPLAQSPSPGPFQPQTPPPPYPGLAANNPNVNNLTKSMFNKALNQTAPNLLVNLLQHENQASGTSNGPPQKMPPPEGGATPQKRRRRKQKSEAKTNNQEKKEKDAARAQRQCKIPEADKEAFIMHLADIMQEVVGDEENDTPRDISPKPSIQSESPFVSSVSHSYSNSPVDSPASSINTRASTDSMLMDLAVSAAAKTNDIADANSDRLLSPIQTDRPVKTEVKMEDGGLNLEERRIPSVERSAMTLDENVIVKRDSDSDLPYHPAPANCIINPYTGALEPVDASSAENSDHCDTDKRRTDSRISPRKSLSPIRSIPPNPHQLAPARVDNVPTHITDNSLTSQCLDDRVTSHALDSNVTPLRTDNVLEQSMLLPRSAPNMDSRLTEAHGDRMISNVRLGSPHHSASAAFTGGAVSHAPVSLVQSPVPSSSSQTFSPVTHRQSTPPAASLPQSPRGSPRAASRPQSPRVSSPQSMNPHSPRVAQSANPHSPRGLVQAPILPPTSLMSTSTLWRPATSASQIRPHVLASSNPALLSSFGLPLSLPNQQQPQPNSNMAYNMDPRKSPVAQYQPFSRQDRVSSGQSSELGHESSQHRLWSPQLATSEVNLPSHLKFNIEQESSCQNQAPVDNIYSGSSPRAGHSPRQPETPSGGRSRSNSPRVAPPSLPLPNHVGENYVEEKTDLVNKSDVDELNKFAPKLQPKLQVKNMLDHSVTVNYALDASNGVPSMRTDIDKIDFSLSYKASVQTNSIQNEQAPVGKESSFTQFSASLCEKPTTMKASDMAGITEKDYSDNGSIPTSLSQGSQLYFPDTRAATKLQDTKPSHHAPVNGPIRWPAPGGLIGGRRPGSPRAAAPNTPGTEGPGIDSDVPSPPPPDSCKSESLMPPSSTHSETNISASTLPTNPDPEKTNSSKTSPESKQAQKKRGAKLSDICAKLAVQQNDAKVGVDMSGTIVHSANVIVPPVKKEEVFVADVVKPVKSPGSSRSHSCPKANKEDGSPVTSRANSPRAAKPAPDLSFFNSPLHRLTAPIFPFNLTQSVKKVVGPIPSSDKPVKLKPISTSRSSSPRGQKDSPPIMNQTSATLRSSPPVRLQSNYPSGMSVQYPNYPLSMGAPLPGHTSPRTRSPVRQTDTSTTVLPQNHHTSTSTSNPVVVNPTVTSNPVVSKKPSVPSSPVVTSNSISSITSPTSSSAVNKDYSVVPSSHMYNQVKKPPPLLDNSSRISNNKPSVSSTDSSSSVKTVPLSPSSKTGLLSANVTVPSASSASVSPSNTASRTIVVSQSVYVAAMSNAPQPVPTQNATVTSATTSPGSVHTSRHVTTNKSLVRTPTDTQNVAPLLTPSRTPSIPGHVIPAIRAQDSTDGQTPTNHDRLVVSHPASSVHVEQNPVKSCSPSNAVVRVVVENTDNDGDELGYPLGLLDHAYVQRTMLSEPLELESSQEHNHKPSVNTVVNTVVSTLDTRPGLTVDKLPARNVYDNGEVNCEHLDTPLNLSNVGKGTIAAHLGSNGPSNVDGANGPLPLDTNELADSPPGSRRPTRCRRRTPTEEHEARSDGSTDRPDSPKIVRNQRLTKRKHDDDDVITLPLGHKRVRRLTNESASSGKTNSIDELLSDEEDHDLETRSRSRKSANVLEPRSTRHSSRSNSRGSEATEDQADDQAKVQTRSSCRVEGRRSSDDSIDGGQRKVHTERTLSREKSPNRLDPDPGKLARPRRSSPLLNKPLETPIASTKRATRSSKPKEYTAPSNADSFSTPSLNKRRRFSRDQQR